MLTSSIDGVYKAGFSIKQQAYEAAVVPLFQSLDRLEKILTGKDYLVGGVLTEADVRLWVTIVSLAVNNSVLLLMCAALSTNRFASTPSTSVTSNAICVLFGTDIPLSIRSSFPVS
jgi:hypothetical protein